MPATQNFIANFGSYVANDDLFALSDHHAILDSGVMSGSFTAPTECFHLERKNSIRQLDEAG